MFIELFGAVNPNADSRIRLHLWSPKQLKKIRTASTRERPLMNLNKNADPNPTRGNNGEAS
jgi:hypothetical protein